MSDFDEGGPAFPTMQYKHGGERDGMNLRDYFAAKAFAAMVGSVFDKDAASIQGPMEEAGFKYPEDWISNLAYRQANAMLKARGE